MTDTTHAPERIWVDFYPRDWPTERIIYGEMPEPYVEYIREDISDAREAAAYEAAADVLLDRGTNVEDPIAVRKDILALTPDDAQAALDRLIAEAVERGFAEGMGTALKVISSIGHGETQDVERGHDDAFRAVQKYLMDGKADAIRNRGKGDD